MSRSREYSFWRASAATLSSRGRGFGASRTDASLSCRIFDTVHLIEKLRRAPSQGVPVYRTSERNGLRPEKYRVNCEVTLLPPIAAGTEPRSMDARRTA